MDVIIFRTASKIKMAIHVRSDDIIIYLVTQYTDDCQRKNKLFMEMFTGRTLVPTHVKNVKIKKLYKIIA